MKILVFLAILWFAVFLVLKVVGSMSWKIAIAFGPLLSFLTVFVLVLLGVFFKWIYSKRKDRDYGI